MSMMCGKCSEVALVAGRDILVTASDNSVFLLSFSLIGVGLEEFGVEEFVAGKFFDGELFLDTQKKSYEAMGFKRFGFLAAIPELLKVSQVGSDKTIGGFTPGRVRGSIRIMGRES